VNSRRQKRAGARPLLLGTSQGPCATLVKGRHGLQMLQVGCLLTYSCGLCASLQSSIIDFHAEEHLLQRVTVDHAEALQGALTTPSEHVHVQHYMTGVQPLQCDTSNIHVSHAAC
jgi:hypothetical protein